MSRTKQMPLTKEDFRSLGSVTALLLDWWLLLLLQDMYVLSFPSPLPSSKTHFVIHQVPCRSAPVFGICATLACSAANLTPIREWLGDELDIFVIHAVGGWVGMILTGC